LNKYKVLVVHPEQQHSYELATALNRAGLLCGYITTVYYRKYSFTYLISLLLNGTLKKRARSRQCSSISSDKVFQYCELLGLFKLMCSYVPFLRRFYVGTKRFVADVFAHKVACYAIKNRVDAVIDYDYTSPLLFEILKVKAPHIKRIKDMSAANRLYMRMIYDLDMCLSLSFANRLKSERPEVWDKIIIDRAKREIVSTQDFLVPSQFVEQSLKFSGIEKENMHLCPYGVNLEQFLPKQKYDISSSRPVKFIYVGGVKELKGIYYLLEAFSQFSVEDAQLTIVGAVNMNDEDIAPYVIKDNIHFTGLVLHDEIPKLLNKADVFVFPSLGDSFALSVLEAMACGLPVIVSENTGSQDLIVNGKEGFVIPIQSVEAIVEKVKWFVEYRDKIEQMGKAARELAIKYTWERYYGNVADIVKGICEK